ncbi:alpha-amylase family glycosyl hydrolase [Anaerolentibacter hominis]|uniref:alpha-amylase family glycosyl hydrolase n=1 Tax=Anaerolentibacter hominis TaxID=3079009 RepID=UPI0031B85DBE
MWWENSVFYQIYPLGFSGAPGENDGAQAPRIRKMLSWSGYLKELGVDTVLFNPVFQSDHHGYDTRSFGEVDARLGTNEDFRDVCLDLKDHGLKVVLDGVFNHVGRGFWAFQDVLKNREDSPYKDWFYIRFDQDNGYRDGLSYEGWEGHFELVKLNLTNPQVVSHLFESIRMWTEEFDIDGLRLDVAYCLDRDFLKQLHHFCRGLKDDFLLIGEVLFGDHNQIVNDEMLDSCTNYECYKGLYSSFNSMNMFEISYSLNRQFGPEPWTIYRGRHLMTFADNHDVTRAASIVTEPAHLPLLYGVLFGMPGIPCLYYGSEWGEKGRKEDGDDALRPCPEGQTVNGLTELIRTLIGIRRGSEALCRGGYKNIMVTNQQLVFERETENERIRVGINAAPEPWECSLPDMPETVTELLSGEELSGQNTVIPGYGMKFWKIR